RRSGPPLRVHEHRQRLDLRARGRRRRLDRAAVQRHRAPPRLGFAGMAATVPTAAGIHCLPIPTPFAVGRVNTYLVEDDPLTLVDSGPNSAKALDELERELERHGHAVEDLQLLVVTHQHIDHLGLLNVLARRSGAEVAALDLL